MKLITLLSSTLVLVTSYAQSADFSLGVNGTYTRSEYKTNETHSALMPVFSYDNGEWYVDGLEAGYYLLNDDKNELTLLLSYEPLAYRASKGYNQALQQLNNRRDTLMAGISYQRTTPIGAFYLQVAQDTLDHSGGINGVFSYSNLLQMNKVNLVSTFGVEWDNQKQNRYFYGISEREAQRSGISAYRPDASWTPFYSMVANYYLTENWETYVMAEASYLPRTVRHSPMVARQLPYSAGVGINYHF